MTDESEYTIPAKPVEPERRRLFVQQRAPDDFGWISTHIAARSDIEQWAAFHGLALVRAGNLDYEVAEADRAALLKVASAAWRDSRSWRHLKDTMHALPEHIRREL